MSEEMLDVEGDVKPEFDQNIPLELTTRAHQSQYNFNSVVEDEVAKAMVTEDVKYPPRGNQFGNYYDIDNWIISSDHCYARPWNLKPEGNFLRPAKTLFIHNETRKRRCINPLAPIQDDEEEIDVESEFNIGTIYDPIKSKNVMEECERYAFAAREEKTEDDWEEKITKISWTPAQYRVFSSMASILNSLNLSKLASKDVINEPVLRRTAIDKAAQRTRRLLGTISWDPKITQWLHHLLIDNLGPHYLSLYLDILQTLKCKLPTFVDKMMYGPSSLVRMSALNNVSLQPLLEKSWDPIQAVSLAAGHLHEKPKKLPGNPVLVVIPSSPVLTRMSHKWIKLLSSLGTVMTVPANLASVLGHRASSTSTISCLDHMYAAARAKIEEARAAHPGRPVVLVGVRAGATLAMRLAKAEPSVAACVVAVGFSLITAEGRRGEPDDEMLELHMPVLFVVGERSDSATPEELEDLRERMRVETGLIVVGAADDYLRISKKKKRAEGITQSIVDRCIVEEIGEFVSGVILSPYPPAVRQSPPSAPVSINTPSSGPVSDVPLGPIRKVGRPPGSRGLKSRASLEAKWAQQQLTQGNTSSTSHQKHPPSSPSPSPPPPLPNYALDTSSNDSTVTEQQQVKIGDSSPPKKTIKTLRPTVVANLAQEQEGKKQGKARLQAYGYNRTVSQGGNRLSNLLRVGIKTIPPAPKPSTSGIKVLENVTLNSSTTAKLIQNRSIDLSKITLINSVKGANTSVGNVLLLPDGKLKTVHTATTVKGTGGTPILLPLSPQRRSPKTAGNYIAMKRQLVGPKPRPIKKSYLPASNSGGAVPPQQILPPPTNLTTQDIMDLPIIFADDNQMIDPNIGSDATEQPQAAPMVITTSTGGSVVTTHQPHKMMPTTVTPGKFMLVNKQSNQGNFLLTSTAMKKATSSPITFEKPSTPKYTKIILSKKTNIDDKTPTAKLLGSDITIKKVHQSHGDSAMISSLEQSSVVELIDLENEIKATAVPKPNLPPGADKTCTPQILHRKMEVTNALKRLSPITDLMDETDPDYIPPKNLKIE